MNVLKPKLQSLGPLRPEAWERIVQLGQQHQIEAGKNLVRHLGTLVYVAEGILKEYDHYERQEPAIIHFIGQDQCLVTRGHQQQRQLQACMPSIVYYWNFDDLTEIYQNFKELKQVYELLCAEYEDGVMFRMRLLEMPVPERIETFKLTFKQLLPYLKKKDMANYLSINYTYLIAIWND